jgi:hypothetical protein
MKAKLLPLIVVLLLGVPWAFGQEQAAPPAKSDSVPVAVEPDRYSPPARQTDRPGPGYGSGERKRYGAVPVPSNDSAKPAEKPADATPEEINRWVKQLDSDEYWTREEASKRLFRAGRAAITALSEAARSEKLEVSTRAIGVLGRLLELDDSSVELAAEAALEEIAAGRVTSSAAHADAALDSYRGSRQERALSKLRQLGATVTPSPFAGEIGSVWVTLGEGWRGTNDDLAILKRVPTLHQLSIYTPKVGDDAMRHLTPLRQLFSLELFRTQISAENIDRLKTTLASTKIEHRRGALLGVQGLGNVVGGGCLVSGVQTDSAADKAGIQPGDIITKFDGQDVEDFPGLTKLIATMAGGESVELEVIREKEVGGRIQKETLKKKAVLGVWKNSVNLNQEIEGEIIIRRR